jgi:outer membrane protein assembly factor BamD (BamD/ComL family)
MTNVKDCHRDTIAVRALVGALLLVLSVGSTARADGFWPFNRKSKTTASSANASGTSIQGVTGPSAPQGGPGAAQPYGAQAGAVQQAGFQQSQPGNSISSANQYQPAPGESLDKAEKDPWYTTIGDKLKEEYIAATFNRAIGQGPNEAAARAAFAAGESAMRAQQYDDAAKQYKMAAKRWPDSLLQEDAMFMMAEAYFFADRYSKAVDAYVALLKKYENSRYLDKVVLREFAIARYWDQVSANYSGLPLPNFKDKTRPVFSTGANATALYDQIRLTDPTGPLADDAVFACGVRLFIDGRYESADHHFDTLRKEYPRSEHQTEGQMLGLRAKMRSYQGAEYEEKPLVEANKLIDSVRLQSPNIPPEERERLQRAQRTILTQQAEREFNNGEYYYRRKFYGSAKYYYREVIKKYPDSAAAELAQKRINETKDLPDEPPDYFGWIDKLLGERDRRPR